MKTDINDAFTDSPPILASGQNLRALDSVVFAAIQAAGKRIGDDNNITWCGLYLIAATMPPAEASATLNSADLRVRAQAMAMELSNDDFDAVMAYMFRVIERREAAQVSVEETPGKPTQDPQATNPETTPQPSI
jgi:hypothetical protein